MTFLLQAEQLQVSHSASPHVSDASTPQWFWASFSRLLLPAYPYLFFVLELDQLSDVPSSVLSSEKFYLLHPPGDVLHNTTLKALSLLHTLHTHVQLGVYQESQDTFCKAALQSLSIQYVLVHGFIPSQETDLELQQAPVSLFLEPTELSLRRRLMTSFNNHSSRLCIICKVAKDSLCHQMR